MNTSTISKEAKTTLVGMGQITAVRCAPPMTIEEVETITASVARTHLRNCHE